MKTHRYAYHHDKKKKSKKEHTKNTITHTPAPQTQSSPVQSSK